MKPNAFVLYIVATIFGCHASSAFVVSNPQSASQSSAQQAAAAAAAAKQQMNSIAAELMGYPAALAATRGRGGGGGGGSAAYMATGSGGGSSSSPLQDSGEGAVYDPGDELLRALNSEMAASGSALGTLPQEPDYADTVLTGMEVASKFDMLRKLEQDLREEQDIVSKSAILMKFLDDPSLDTLPVVYVEEVGAPLANGEDDDDVDVDDEGANVNLLYPPTSGMAKRSRYYRRYPWKRHNRNRSHYEPELRYACTPSKEDVFKLLVGLHENRKGNHHKTVQFCNRKRPAKAIFTNIRFLG